MRRGETHRFLIMLYILVLLFLGAIFVQSQIDADPASVAALATIKNPETTSQPLTAPQSFSVNGESAALLFLSLTGFFGFAWVMNRSNSY